MYNDDNIGNDNMNNDDNGTNSINSENTNNSTMNNESTNNSTMNSEDTNNSTMNSEDTNNCPMNSENMSNSTMNEDSMYNNMDDLNITENDMSNDNMKDNNMLNNNFQREIEINTYRISDINEVNSAQDKQKEKNKNKTGKKILAFALSAALFGGLAGGAFLTTTYVGNQYLNLASNESEADTAAESQDSSARTVSNVETTAEASTGTDSTNTVSSVASAVMPSIVSITNKSVQEVQSMFGMEAQEYESESSGSGIIVGQNDTELLIATNNHVVDGADSISATFIDDTVVEAQVKGTDPENDLAVIAVKLEDISADTLGQIEIAELGDSDSVVIGQEVVAIGNALGYGQSVTTGIVSALDREVTIDNITSSLIQTDAAINPGNSGGALLNMQGQVIAINSSKFASTEVEGMGYAIPISTAKPIIEQLMLETTKEKVAEEERGYLGISGQDVTSEISQAYDMPIGVYIGEIQDGSGLADSGIVKGNIITGFEGKTITTISYLQSLLEYYKIGDTVTITVASEEGGEYIEKTVEVTLMGSTTTTQQETTQERITPGVR